MSNNKDDSPSSSHKNQTFSIVIKIVFFLVPFLIIFIMSRFSGKSYTNSMADYTLYKRYFVAGLFSLFLILALIFAAKEYEKYKTTKDPHALSLAKVSMFAAGVFIIFLVILGISIYILKRLPTKQRARIEAFNRTTNGIRTTFDIFRS